MARVLLVTPAGQGSRQGNQITARRWATLFRQLGHRVDVQEDIANARYDVLIALHARKSAAGVRHAAENPHRRPIILALTGTDLYHDLRTSATARRSLELATRIVILQSEAYREVPQRHHEKTRVILQSALPPRVRPKPLKRVFEVCVSGHLRTEKDPFRAELASRRLPATSRIRITHVGGALSSAMERRARAATAANPRYRWLGEVPHWKARQLLDRARLLVHSSRMEGGANVLAEAMVSGVPVLSTKIAGSVGMLGEDYPAYFDVGSTKQLAGLLRRCETDATFTSALRRYCRHRSKLFQPRREQAAWKRLLNEVL